jgi:hypothetical protein
MNPVNQYRFYELGAKLYRVTAHSSSVGAADMFVPLMEAQNALDNLIKGDPITLEFAKTDANNLLNRLGALFNRYFIDTSSRQFRFPSREEQIDVHELAMLRSLVEKFETALSAELNRRAIYIVPRRGLFDAHDLAEKAEMQFDEETLARMNEPMREEIRSAGRALAFGLPAAACFHLIRAIEGALSIYMEGVSRTAVTNSDNLWKDVLNRLGGAEKDKFLSTDARLAGLLREVDTRYRATLAKPGASITMQEALIFFGTSGSLVTLVMESTAQRRGPALGKMKEAKDSIESLDDEDDDAETSPRSKSA